MAVRIIAIRKAGGNHYDPHEAISHYQWINEQTNESDIATRPEMVAWIEQGNQAYVRSNEGTVYCYVNQSVAGTKFLQTQADSQSSNNFLDLPEY